MSMVVEVEVMVVVIVVVVVVVEMMVMVGGGGLMVSHCSDKGVMCNKKKKFFL